MRTGEQYPDLKPSRKGFVANYPPFRQWKKMTPDEMVNQKPVNIYVHIPFCAQRCAYCYYRTLKGTSRVEMERYVNVLCQEIEIAAEQFQLHNRPVVSIYIGGGTPTILPESCLSRLAECLRTHLHIEEPEFTVEAEPVTLTSKKADLLKSLQVNRISLGVQSFNDTILKLADRQDSEAKVLRAIDLAQSTGAVVNIDLLSGLAGETEQTWTETLQRALATDIESITVYKMELYANTEYYKELRQQRIELPSDDQEREFMRYALQQFTQNDYLPWSFFTFTKQGGYTHQYATSIWRGTDCYAFGASGFGQLGNRLFQNTNEVDKYMTLIEAGELPIQRGYIMTVQDRMIRTVLLGMKLVRFSLREFQQNFGVRLERLCKQTLQELESKGFVTLSEDGISLTSKGLLYGDYAGKKISEALKNLL